MDGIYNGGQAAEALQQAALTRHRILTVNCGTDLTAGWNSYDASGMASADPNLIAAGSVNAVTPRGIEGGPHFILGKDTPDGSKTYGFEFCVFLDGITTAGERATAGVGGYDVTVWVLIANTQSPKPASSSSIPVWASFLTLTGVSVQELYHTFDVNATAIRFQFGNLADDPTLNNDSIQIALAEL